MLVFLLPAITRQTLKRYMPSLRELNLKKSGTAKEFVERLDFFSGISKEECLNTAVRLLHESPFYGTQFFLVTVLFPFIFEFLLFLSFSPPNSQN